MRICIFCGSSSGAHERYGEAAVALAQYLAGRGIGIVYGGARLGLMGKVAEAALQAGGEVIGVMPQALVDKEIAYQALADLRIVGSMHERKAQMAQLSDAFLALPGGYGTFEELCEVLTWTQLGLQRKACGILNVGGYYDALLSLFDHAVAEQFLKPVHREIVIADSDPERLVRRVMEFEPPLVNKWIDMQGS